MNTFQIKQRDRIIDPNRFPTRQLDDYEKQFQAFLRTTTDDTELSPNQNSFLNTLAGLYR